MARKLEDIEGEEKGELKKEFEVQNPAYWDALQNRPEDIVRVRKVLAHTQETVEELEADYRETKESRLARQELKVFEERSKQAFVLRTPLDEDRLSKHSIQKEARKREILALMSRLNAVETNGDKAIEAITYKDGCPKLQTEERSVANMSAEERATHFKGRVHEAVENAQKARRQASRLFNENREELVDRARASGSENPERDASRAQREIVDGVEKQLHADLHGIFVEAGWDRDHQAVEFMAHQETKEDISHLVDKLEEVTARQKATETAEPSHAADRTQDGSAPAQEPEETHDANIDHDESHSRER